MKRLARALFAALLATAGTAAQGDVVTDWNTTSYAIMRAVQVDGAPGARALAIVHVSMADAINTVQNRHERYAYRGPLQPSASAEVAAASAARTALVALWPAQQARIEERYTATKRAVPEGPAAAAGEAVGKAAAEAVLGDRADDSSNVPDSYRPLTNPGVWIPTTPPITAQYARVKPWGFERPDQFRPGPPPTLGSPEYAKDYNETKSLGGLRSTVRTKEQSDAVRFWSQPNIMEAWHQVARQLAGSRKLDLAECARLFALLTMANANTYIIDWDAKFHYNYWRPVTAIRNGDNDGNDATERDAGWTPLNATPMHPEYPSQAAILAGAGTAALVAMLGGAPAVPVRVVDSADPKVAREFTNVAALAEEQRLVRIWGGIHFRTSLEVSDRMGHAMVRHLAATTYRPVR